LQKKKLVITDELSLLGVVVFDIETRENHGDIAYRDLLHTHDGFDLLGQLAICQRLKCLIDELATGNLFAIDVKPKETAIAPKDDTIGTNAYRPAGTIVNNYLASGHVFLLEVKYIEGTGIKNIKTKDLFCQYPKALNK